MFAGTNEALLMPFAGMMLLTMLVWLYMYFYRFRWIAEAKVSAQSLAQGVKSTEGLPPKVVNPPANFRNLFELPVLFYALCLALITMNAVTETQVILAWGFLIFRVLNSLIHCTINIVKWRFLTYLGSALCLWAQLILAVADLLAA
ncbi:MAG: MAPEG family protein [Pseudomonadota bacterium]